MVWFILVTPENNKICADIMSNKTIGTFNQNFNMIRAGFSYGDKGWWRWGN